MLTWFSKRTIYGPKIQLTQSLQSEARNTLIVNYQVSWIPPAGGLVVESRFPQAGRCVGVDHSMNHVVKGAAFAVLTVNNSTAGDHFFLCHSH